MRVWTEGGLVIVAQVEMRRLGSRAENRAEELLTARARAVAIIDGRKREDETRVLEIKQ